MYNTVLLTIPVQKAINHGGTMRKSVYFGRAEASFRGCKHLTVTIRAIIIHSKYFPDSDWLKAYA